MISLMGEEGGGLLVYALGALSRARDAIRAAAFSMFDDTFGRVIGLLFSVGLSGNGGGALSGSELSHLLRTLAITFKGERIVPTWVPKSDRSRNKCGHVLLFATLIGLPSRLEWKSGLST